MDCIWIFFVVWKWMFFARFLLSGSRCMSDVITSIKLELTGKIFWDSPCCFSAWVICVLSPAHESEMRGYLVYVLIVKNFSHWFCLNSATVLDWMVLSWNLGGGFFETFFEGSVDHFIYRDYIVNRHFFIYCSLACMWHQPRAISSPPLMTLKQSVLDVLHEWILSALHFTDRGHRL